jgi:hypothetical protein
VRVCLCLVSCIQLRIDRPVCVDVVPKPPHQLPPGNQLAPGSGPSKRAVNVLAELPRCLSPDGKRDVILTAMGTTSRCVQVGRTVASLTLCSVQWHLSSTVEVECLLCERGMGLEQ